MKKNLYSALPDHVRDELNRSEQWPEAKKTIVSHCKEAKSLDELTLNQIKRLVLFGFREVTKEQIELQSALSLISQKLQTL
jgi:hypothetical protein